MRLIFSLSLLLALLAPALPAAGTLPQADVRAIRELQARNLGTPSLDAKAAAPEALLALAELGGNATAQGAAWTGNDQDALYALLQRYRDELLALGMDSAELEAQLERLQARTTEVERRLEGLKPKDGLKIHARMYSLLDDLHVYGNAGIPSLPVFDGRPQKPAKNAYQDVRSQFGAVGGILDLEGTRGPVSGRAMLGFAWPWGTQWVSVAPRRVYLELRLPITLQFGDIDLGLTPLTLWRNDTVDPFVPEPFASRERRLRDDLLFKPDFWRLRGGRASSDVRLFNALDLKLESFTGIMANSTNGVGTSAANNFYQVSGTVLTGLMARYNIYLEAWRVRAAFGEGKELSYQGTLFWDDTSTLTNTPAWNFTAMNELVHSFDAAWRFGGLDLRAEAALSSYVAPALINTPAPDPMTGTAYAADLGWSGAGGRIGVFAHGATAGFHAAGAQGRTVDAGLQWLGPFMTENSQLDGSGKVGFAPPMVTSNTSRLNDVLIPPGMVRAQNTAGLGLVGSPWTHLLGYFPHEEIDAYGQATPNRAVFGGAASWALWKKSIKPLLSYEAGAEPEPVADTLGNTHPGFALSRIRAGAEFDLEPLIGWPVSFGGGWAGTTSSNGESDPTGKAFSLNTSLLDAGLCVGKGHPFGLAAGWRSLAYEGLHPVIPFSSPSDKQSWDILAVGGWWRPQDGTSVDLVYSAGHMDVPDYPLLGLQHEQVVLRLTTEF